MPNHLPAPVINVLGPALPGADDCKKLKQEHKVVTRQHKKGASKSTGKESHHILQDAAMKGLVSKYSGFAVLLDASAGGSHDQINAKQIARNCGPKPPMTFGALVKASRDDLADMFKYEGKDSKTAKQLADCITIEAVRHTQRARTKKRRERLKTNTEVKKVAGCLASETLVWMVDGSLRRADEVAVGMVLAGGHVVRRRGGCTSELIRIVTEHGTVRLTPAHRLRLVGGASVRADRLRRGVALASPTGPSRVLAASRIAPAERVFSLEFDTAVDVPIGMAGVLSIMPVLGPPTRPSDPTEHTARGVAHATS